MESSRDEEVDRSTHSVCSSKGDESLTCYGPMSPTFKVNNEVSQIQIIQKSESVASASETLPLPNPHHNLIFS